MWIKKSNIFVVIVFGILGFFLFRSWAPSDNKEVSGRAGEKTPHLGESLPISKPEEKSAKLLARFKNRPPKRLNGETIKSDLALAPPSTEQVRLEATEDPHSTPSSILEFAAMLGPKMEQALEAEDSALPLFEELESCSLNSTLPTTVQSICLSNARLLAQKHSKLESQWTELEQKASPEATRLLGVRSH